MFEGSMLTKGDALKFKFVELSFACMKKWEARLWNSLACAVIIIEWHERIAIKKDAWNLWP